MTSALNPRSGLGDVGREDHSTSGAAAASAGAAIAFVVVDAAAAAPAGGASLFEDPVPAATVEDCEELPFVPSLTALATAAAAADGPLEAAVVEGTVPRASRHRQLVPAVWPSA